MKVVDIEKVGPPGFRARIPMLGVNISVPGSTKLNKVQIRFEILYTKSSKQVHNKKKKIKTLKIEL